MSFNLLEVAKKYQKLLQAKDPKKISSFLGGLSELQGRALYQLVQSNRTAFGLEPLEKPDHNIPDDPAGFAEKWSLKINPNQPWVRARHLDLISSYLADMYAGKCKRVMISVAPRRGKSSLVSYWSIIWRLAKNPTHRIALCSYSQELAVEWSSRIRNFIRDYGSEIGLELDPSSTAKHYWRTKQGGSVLAVGRGGPMTGFGFDHIVIDDILKNAEEASSEAIKKECWEWYVSVVASRQEPNTTFVTIGTRWAFDDLLGKLEQLSNSGEGSKWDIIRLPEIAEPDDPLGREVGELLWPERFPMELVMEQKKATPSYFWSALYQQTPVPTEGGMFKFHWWQHYKVLPDLNKFDIILQSWDFSFKDTKKSDYVVGQVWGRMGARFYLIDQIRAQMSARDSMDAIRAFTKKYPQARAKLFEDKANGPALKALLDREIGGIIPINPKGSKEARAMACQPFVEAGNVYLPDPSIAPWVNDFELECGVFPFGAHDDCIDGMSLALNYLAPGGYAIVSRAQRDATREHEGRHLDPRKAVERQFWTNMKKEVKKNLLEQQGKLPGRGDISGNW